MQLKQKCSFEVGDGCKIRFWEDTWSAKTPLFSTFPSIYEEAESKGARVESWEAIGSRGCWNFIFERPTNDWEIEVVQRFISTVSSKRIDPQFKDRLLSKEAKDGTFTVESNFDLLEGERQQSVPIMMLKDPFLPK